MTSQRHPYDLLELLTEDLERANRALEEDTAYSRRTLVRTFFAALDGYTSALEHWALELARKWPDSFTRDELNRLQRPATTEKGYRRSSTERLLFAIEICTQYHELDFTVDRSGTEYRNFKRAVALRNSVVHPRIAADLDVSDEALRSAAKAADWISQQIAAILRVPDYTRLGLPSYTLMKRKSQLSRQTADVANTLQPTAARKRRSSTKPRRGRRA